MLLAGFLWVHYRESQRPRRVVVCAHDGKPVWNAVVALRHGGEKEADFSDRTLADGSTAIPRDRIHEDSEMLVVAPGFGIVRGALPDDDRVVLPDAFAVTLRIGGDFDLPEQPAAIELKLSPASAEPWEVLALQSAVVPGGFRPGLDLAPNPPGTLLLVDPETRAATVLVPRLGAWTVSWNVGVAAPAPGTVWTGKGPADEIPIEIREPGETVALEIPRQEIAKYAAER